MAGIGAEDSTEERFGRYACLAVTAEFLETRETSGGLLGHPYRVRIDFDTGRYAYCKIAGRPGGGTAQARPRADGAAGLRRRAVIDPGEDPLALFGRWFEEARAKDVFQPEAMAVASATPDGAPSARMVLMKGFDERGITFFTNYGSRKGAELEANPRAALLFHWSDLGRQVRIEGPVSRVDRAESEAYARSRPRASQLSAAASPQSRPVPDREWLERQVEELDREHADGEVPLREDWGGYRVRAGGVGVLGAPRQPAARPLPLQARRRRRLDAWSGSRPSRAPSARCFRPLANCRNESFMSGIVRQISGSSGPENSSRIVEAGPPLPLRRQRVRGGRP